MIHESQKKTTSTRSYALNQPISTPTLFASPYFRLERKWYTTQKKKRKGKKRNKLIESDAPYIRCFTLFIYKNYYWVICPSKRACGTDHSISFRTTYCYDLRRHAIFHSCLSFVVQFALLNFELLDAESALAVYLPYGWRCFAIYAPKYSYNNNVPSLCSMISERVERWRKKKEKKKKWNRKIGVAQKKADILCVWGSVSEKAYACTLYPV